MANKPEIVYRMERVPQRANGMTDAQYRTWLRLGRHACQAAQDGVLASSQEGEGGTVKVTMSKSSENGGVYVDFYYDGRKIDGIRVDHKEGA
jgi:hypothetical protein